MIRTDAGFWLKVGDRVDHVKDIGFPGTVISIDWNLVDCGYGVTTVEVVWDDADTGVIDVVWSNKLAMAEVNYDKQ